MNYSNIYNIDFRKLSYLLVPPFLRGTTQTDWIFCLLKPLRDVNFSLKKFRKNSIYKVSHNGQVVYLQKVLNDAFDNEFRRIYIKDSFYIEPIWVYPENNNLPVYINENEPLFVYKEEDFVESENDFIVVMPQELKPISDFNTNILEIQIKSLVNYYKLASKRYTIEWT